jgi:ribonuclease HII
MDLNKKEWIIGIDDAGRGPVLGSMCLAGVLIESDIEEYLKKSGVQDSKLLTPTSREKLAPIIKDKVLDFKFKLITPIEIDTGMGIGLNLNEVEALASASIINDLTMNLKENEKNNLRIILDCPSINISGWKSQLMSYITDKTLENRIFCEHKADLNHVVVSAASIIAKTTRDAEIQKLKKEIGIDFGSGYPSDPTTKDFLEKNANNPKFKGLFRESWATWKNAVNKTKEKQGKLF